jgi:type I restriction enzyme R subunit
VRKIVDKYIYEQRVPLKDEIAGTLKVKPKLLERKKVIPRVLDKIVGFIEKFYDDMGIQTTINNSDYSKSIEALKVAQPKPEYI